jgi:hypothetical protein
VSYDCHTIWNHRFRFVPPPVLPAVTSEEKESGSRRCQTVPMRQQCSECQRLWREYAAATTAHIRLEGKLRTAAGKQLAAEVAAAAKLRESLRQDIQKHETTVHGSDADAAETDE